MNRELFIWLFGVFFSLLTISFVSGLFYFSNADVSVLALSAVLLCGAASFFFGIRLGETISEVMNHTSDKRYLRDDDEIY